MKAINMKRVEGHYRFPFIHMAPSLESVFHVKMLCVPWAAFSDQKFFSGKKTQKSAFLTFHRSPLGCKVRAQLRVENRDK